MCATAAVNAPLDFFPRPGYAEIESSPALANLLMTNPVLVEITRGPLVECCHRGVLAVVANDGRIVLELGDTARPVYPRSAVKPLQALPLIETNAAAAFGFADKHIAIAAASHSGTRDHVEAVRDMLRLCGLDERALHCGTHLPRDEAEQRALLMAGAKPGALHHNCSGKHAGMLATARHLGEAIEGYWETSHPVQERIRVMLEDLCGMKIRPDVCGIDGCMVPNWALPANALAQAFANFGAGSGFSNNRVAAACRIMDAALAAPDYFAGPTRFDTRVLKQFGGAAFVKTGAEGAYAGTFPEAGLGFALKIDDGATRAAEAVVSLLIEAFVPAARGQLPLKTIKNAQGIEVGVVRPSEVLSLALG